MKRIIYAIIILAVFGFGIWLVLRLSTEMPRPNTVPPTPSNTAIASVVSNAPATQPALASTNAFVRPSYIAEDQWNRLMLIRQLALAQNQPVEFYARVVDQNNQPVDGAGLGLKLTRTDEKMFETTNFFSRQMGDEVLIIPFELFSDSNGWIRLTGTNGDFLDMTGLSKEGYLSSCPNGNFGGVHYEPSGMRNTYGGDILLTNALDSQRGYILHLQKIEETNAVNSNK